MVDGDADRRSSTGGGIDEGGSGETRCNERIERMMNVRTAQRLIGHVHGSLEEPELVRVPTTHAPEMKP